MSAWTQLMEPGPALIILVLVFIPQTAYSAPLENEVVTEIQYYPVADATGCYYNFEHYDEGDRIITNEPCLNCTCHNRMLMCYLRVCPFTKAIGQDCKVEKKADQCCPVITCPEVHVQVSHDSSTPPSTAIGHLNEYGCSIDNLFYADGAKVPSNPNNPCEVCYCIRNKTACIIQECTLTGKVVEGCRPVYIEGVCCPLRYDCDHPEIETTPRPLLTTTTTSPTTLMPTTTQSPTQCIYNNDIYGDGALVKKDIPCEKCYCMRGDIICAVQECGPTPLDKANCTALPIKEGHCCPDTYDCDKISEEDLTTISSYVPTTQPTIITRADDLTTEETKEPEEPPTTVPAPIIEDRNKFETEGERKDEMSSTPKTEEKGLTPEVSETATESIASAVTEAVTDLVHAITTALYGEPKKEDELTTEAADLKPETTPGSIDKEPGQEIKKPHTVPEEGTTELSIENTTESKEPASHDHSEEPEAADLTTPLPGSEDAHTRPIDQEGENQKPTTEEKQQETEVPPTKLPEVESTVTDLGTNEKETKVTDGIVRKQELTTSKAPEETTPLPAVSEEEAKTTEKSKETEESKLTEEPNLTESPKQSEETKPTEEPKEAEETKPTEVPKEAEETKLTEGPKEAEETKPTEGPTETKVSTEIDESKSTERPKEIDETTEKEGPKGVEESTERDISKTTENETEEPKDVEGPKGTEEPTETAVSQETEEIKPTEGLEEVESKPTEKSQETEESQPTEGPTQTEESKSTEGPKVTEETIKEKDESIPTDTVMRHQELTTSKATEEFTSQATTDKQTTVQEQEPKPTEEAKKTELPLVPELSIGSTEKEIEATTTEEIEIITSGPMNETEKPLSMDHVSESGSTKSSEEKTESSATVPEGVSTEKTRDTTPKIELEAQTTLAPGKESNEIPEIVEECTKESCKRVEKIPTKEVPGKESDHTESNQIPEGPLKETEKPEEVTESVLHEKEPEGVVTTEESTPKIELAETTPKIEPEETSKVEQQETTPKIEPEEITTPKLEIIERVSELSTGEEQLTTSQPGIKEPEKETEDETKGIETTTPHDVRENEIPTEKETSAEPSATEKQSTDEPVVTVTPQYETTKKSGQERIKEPTEITTELPYQEITTERPEVQTEAVSEELETAKPEIPAVVTEKSTDEVSESTISVEEKVSSGEEGTRSTTELSPTETEVTPGEEREHGIPGEGSCLVEGKTYSNNSDVPVYNHCQASCRCVSSIVRCKDITCPQPPEGCELITPKPRGTCCPAWSCAKIPEITGGMESSSQVIDTTTVGGEEEGSGSSPTEKPEENTLLPVELSGEKHIEKEGTTVAVPTETETKVGEPQQGTEVITESSGTSVKPEHDESQNEIQTPEETCTKEGCTWQQATPGKQAEIEKRTEAIPTTELENVTEKIETEGERETTRPTIEKVTTETKLVEEVTEATTIRDRLPEAETVSSEGQTESESETKKPKIPEEQTGTERVKLPTESTETVPKELTEGKLTTESVTEQTSSKAQSESGASVTTERNEITEVSTEKLLETPESQTTLTPLEKDITKVEEPTEKTEIAETTVSPAGTGTTHSVEIEKESESPVPLVTQSGETRQSEVTTESVEQVTEAKESITSKPIESADHVTEAKGEIETTPTILQEKTKETEEPTTKAPVQETEKPVTVASVEKIEKPSTVIAIQETEKPKDELEKQPEATAVPDITRNKELESTTAGHEAQITEKVTEKQETETERQSEGTTPSDKELQTEKVIETTTISKKEQETETDENTSPISSEEKPISINDRLPEIETESPTTSEEKTEVTTTTPKEEPQVDEKSTEESITEVEKEIVPVTEYSEKSSEIPVESGTQPSTETEQPEKKLEQKPTEEPTSLTEGVTKTEIASEAPGGTETTIKPVSSEEQVTETEGITPVIRHKNITETTETSISETVTESGKMPDTEIKPAEVTLSESAVTTVPEEKATDLTEKTVSEVPTEAPIPEQITEGKGETTTSPAEVLETSKPAETPETSRPVEVPVTSGPAVTHAEETATVRAGDIANVTSSQEEIFTSPQLSTESPKNESIELFTSGPHEASTIRSQVEGELSTSIPLSQSTEFSTTPEPEKSHEIPGEHEHVPEVPFPGEDYDEDEEPSPLGPGTCRYGGKVFVSAQQIPRDDPCDFCFCFRSDIICLQQSCPPPIPNCHEEPIRGFCCPRYECPVSMATSVNVTTTTTTTTTTLPPNFLAHVRGRATRNGCQIDGKAYKVGEYIKSASGPCMHCTCGGDGQMKCDPKQCSPEPMLRQMIAAASRRRR